MLAQKPEDQLDRLAELARFKVLDTGAERPFDDVVGLAARICDAPVALISFVDADRQWFKAQVGFDKPETPLAQSICSHAILSDDLLEIPDTDLDIRTADNPLCCGVEARMRFYAGAPLVTAQGFRLGTLCVLDTKPRALNDLQRDTLRILADQVMRQLELRRALDNEVILRDEIDHRVKNSLQTVVSFIRIYRSAAKNDRERASLDAISRRVDAISQLHAELYQTSTFDTVRIDSYLGRVGALLQRQAPRDVRVDWDVLEAEVNSRVAATLAMIVGEFCANAFKHAFPNGRGGTVRIALQRRADGGLALDCRDDGVGNAAKRPDEQVQDIVSIGTRLMESAAEQIGAAIELTPGPDGYRLRLDLADTKASELPGPFRADVPSAG